MDSQTFDSSSSTDRHPTSFIPHNPFGSSASPSSQHGGVLESLWADSTTARPQYHDQSSSSQMPAYFEMTSLPTPHPPHHRNSRRRPRASQSSSSHFENDNNRASEEDQDEANTITDLQIADCSYEPHITSGGGKKRRLTAEQVQFLERSFELENKLEPERKSRLALELGLEPRQVAIWFQNRRARFKTKTIEREFDGLRSRYDKLRGDYETVLKEKEKLKDEVSLLTAKLKLRETPDSDPSPSLNHLSNTRDIKHRTAAATVEVKVEEVAASSAKSDVLDSDSPPPHPTVAECNYYHYYYNLAAPETTLSLVDQPEEEEQEEFQLTRSLFPPAPPPVPYEGFHQQDGGCSGFALSSAGVQDDRGADDQLNPRSSLWPWLY